LPTTTTAPTAVPDSDGINDVTDRCPDQAEDNDAFHDDDGWPDLDDDGDGDGVLDNDDRCVRVAGCRRSAQRGLAVHGGCADGDGDGIVDDVDRWPAHVRQATASTTATAAPTKRRALVVGGGDRITRAEQVFFDSGKDTLQQRSGGLRDRVATVLRLHPEVKRVRVEDHTDDASHDAKNLDLSKRRVQSVVQALVTRGIDAGRLNSEGSGERARRAVGSSCASSRRGRRRRRSTGAHSPHDLATRPANLATMSQIRLENLLLQAGVINEQQLAAAMQGQKEWGGRLGAILVRMGVLTDDALVLALSRLLNMPRVALGPTEPLTVPPAVLERVERALCERHAFVPIAFVPERGALQVAVAEPSPGMVLDDLGRQLGVRIEPVLASEHQIQQAITRLYSGAAAAAAVPAAAALHFVDNSGGVLGTRPSRPASAKFPSPAAPPPTAPSLTTPVGTPMTVAATVAATTATAQHAPEELRAAAEQQRRAARALAVLLVQRGLLDPTVLQRARG